MQKFPPPLMFDASIEIQRAVNGYVVYLPSTNPTQGFVQIIKEVQSDMNMDKNDLDQLVPDAVSDSMKKESVFPVKKDMHVFTNYKDVITFLAMLEDNL